MAEFTGVFTNADGNLFAETYNQLNAYFATVPGNYALNFRQLYLLADNIQEIFWMIDAETKKALYVTEAYETITGFSCQSLLENPSSYEQLIHPETAFMCWQSLEKPRRQGTSMKDFGSCAPAANCVGSRCMGFRYGMLPAKSTVLSARFEKSLHRRKQRTRLPSTGTAESARAESDALSKATLALTADLRMDFVLDTLLESLLELVPGECARVLLLEGNSQLLVARENCVMRLPRKPRNIH